MNRFKPGDKARVIKGGYFKIGDTVSVIQVHSEHNLTVKNDAGYRRLMYSSDLEPIEPVQEEERPWIDMLLKKKGEYLYKLEHAGNNDYAIKYSAKLKAIEELLHPDPEVF